MSCATAVSIKKNRSCISCFKNKQTSTLIENVDSKIIKFLLKYSNLFTLFVSLFTFVLFSFAKFNNFFNTYKSSCERDSNFRSFNKFNTLWRWITLSLSSSICERRIDINTDMNRFSFKIILFTCFSSTCWREWVNISNLICAEISIVNCYTKWMIESQNIIDQERVQNLYWYFEQIIDFVIFKNEKKNAEIEMRITQNVKDFFETSHKRLFHCLMFRDRDYEQFLLIVLMQF